MVLFDFIVLRSPTQCLDNMFNVPQNLPHLFKGGLYLASREFYKQLEKVDHLPDDQKSKIKKSLLKYWLRSSTRCTPFGSFAGLTVVPLTNDDSEIILKESIYHSKKVRLDMAYIYFLISEIEKLPLIQDQIKLLTNNSIYETPLDFRYAESFVINSYKDYRLSAVEKSDYLSFVLEKSVKGISVKELSSSLCAFAGVDYESAKEFIIELWHSQLLISSLEPCLTGTDPLEQLSLELQDYYGHEKLKEQLKKLLSLLNHPENCPEYYVEIENHIKNLFPSPQHIKNLIQTDLFLSCEKKSFNNKVIETVLSQVKDIMVLANVCRNPDLDNFKKKFTEKYENKTIPLTIALDADLGIGYADINESISGGNTLINDIGLASPNSTHEQVGSYLQDYVLNKYLDYLKSESDGIIITENELNTLRSRKQNFIFPSSMAVHGTLMKKDNLLDQDNFLFSIRSVGGPSAVNLLGRFTQGDADVFDLAKNALSAEERDNPEVIFAEIVHLPQTRLGNVLLRSVLRDYEIPYVGKSGVKQKNQILISDLHIAIRNNEIILISKNNNKRVIPRLSTAHNFNNNSLPIYKFLCDLQYQSLSFGGIWDWGRLEQMNHLPRVIYKNTIIKKARWKIELNEISDVPKLKEDCIIFFDQYITMRKIPQYALMVESDNKILIDFTNHQTIDIFLTHLKRNKVVMLEEFVCTIENCIIKDTKGQSYTNEIIIPVSNLIKETQKLRKFDFKDNIIDKKYSPSSNWIYFKIYCSPKTADKFLSSHLSPFIATQKEKGLFEQFFFIRYKDSRSHLRIRFYNSAISKQNKVLVKFMKLLEPLLENNLIEDVSLDTYVQETERYGANLITDAERLFCIDSLATLKLLDLPDDNEDKNQRFFLSMRGLDALMNDFKLSLPEKKDLLKKLSDNFFKEFGGSPALQKNINNKYKNLKQQIFGFMDSRNDLKNSINEAAIIFQQRSIENADVVNRILHNTVAKDNKDSLYELLSSYIHMSLNRLFISHQRKYELVIYIFLERYYTSLIAIGSKAKEIVEMEED